MIGKKEILLSRKEVAEKFKVSYPTLKQWRDRNILPACKLGKTIRYKNSDIEKLLNDSQS